MAVWNEFYFESIFQRTHSSSAKNCSYSARWFAIIWANHRNLSWSQYAELNTRHSVCRVFSIDNTFAWLLTNKAQIALLPRKWNGIFWRRKNMTGIVPFAKGWNIFWFISESSFKKVIADMCTYMKTHSLNWRFVLRDLFILYRTKQVKQYSNWKPFAKAVWKIAIIYCLWKSFECTLNR